MWPFKKKIKHAKHDVLDKQDEELLSKEGLIKEDQEFKKDEGLLKSLFRRKKKR